MALIAVLSAPAAAHGATFSLLHDFGVATNVTGLTPSGALVQAPDGTLYGTTANGEGGVRGVVFRVRPDGSGFSAIKWFTSTNVNDGIAPEAGLALSGGQLYGATSKGGSNGVGTVFSLSTNGAGFTVLHTFGATNGPAATNADGAVPLAGLVESNGMLYGTACFGGVNGNGAIFALSTNGTAFTNLHSFTAGTPVFAGGSLTNGDGMNPVAGLLLANGVLYGTAKNGGTNNLGTVFSLGTNGSGFTALHYFNEVTGDGSSPEAGLVISGNTLYGATSNGGTNGWGTVFSLTTNGMAFQALCSFTFSQASMCIGLALSGNMLYGTASLGGTNNGGGSLLKLNVNGSGLSFIYNFMPKSVTPDGGYTPLGGVIVSNNILYGTLSQGGPGMGGTLFAVDTNGIGFTNLVDFGFSDAAFPLSPLLLSGGRLYGTAGNGGRGYGTVFALATDGIGFTNLHSFTNGDGSGPIGSLSLSGSTLFGVTHFGGANLKGTVYSIGTNGAAFTNLLTFSKTTGSLNTNATGSVPEAGVTLAGGALYGTGYRGGLAGQGNVFAIATDGTGFNPLHYFSATNASLGTNTDGAQPAGDLLAAGDLLFGTASLGGANGYGALFSINTNGQAFTNFYSFTGIDGAAPVAGLVSDGSRFYGTTIASGTGSGTVYSIATNGSGFSTLHTFTATNSLGMNADGAYPIAQLLLLNQKLYGTAEFGGTYGGGTIFSLNSDGSGFTTLLNFGYTNGALPEVALTGSANTLYGATTSGGTVGDGIIFSLTLDPTLTFQKTAGQLILTWPDPGFFLQSATNVSGPYTTLSGATSPYTNSMGSSQQFFRLIGP